MDSVLVSRLMKALKRCCAVGCSSCKSLVARRWTSPIYWKVRLVRWKILVSWTTHQRQLRPRHRPHQLLPPPQQQQPAIWKPTFQQQAALLSIILSLINEHDTTYVPLIIHVLYRMRKKINAQTANQLPLCVRYDDAHFVLMTVRHFSLAVCLLCQCSFSKYHAVSFLLFSRNGSVYVNNIIKKGREKNRTKA